MKGKRSILSVASIALILVLLLTGCNGSTTPTPSPSSSTEPTATPTVTPTPGQTATPTPQVVEVDKQYRVLNPAGEFIPVQTFALSPRLASIDGKRIYVVQGEADPVIMPALAAALPAKFTKTTFVYYQPSSGFGPTAPDDTTIAEADGVIRGNGW